MDNWRCIKIFVSSTFKDMDVERDIIRMLVEPKLNEFLAEYNCSVEFVDLRHSVKTDKSMSEEEKERAIFSICMDEIDSCSPYFIGFLGHRYGWVPPAYLTDSIVTPENLEIDENELSVTLREFLRGAFLNPESKSLIFLRDESSYRNLSPKELSDFVESDDGKAHVETLRNFVQSGNFPGRVIRYSLDLSSHDIKQFGGFAEEMIAAVKDLLADVIEERKENGEVESFMSAQNKYVFRKTKNYVPREIELAECLKKIEQRGTCSVSFREQGVGVSSFVCALYRYYAENRPDAIPLFYSKAADSRYNSLEDAIEFWSTYLKSKFIAYDDYCGNLSCFKDICGYLKNKGRQVYVFLDGSISIGADMNTIAVNTVLYSDEIEYLKPMLYELGALSRKTIAGIVEPLRPQVRKSLIEHKCSGNVKWLSIATRILDRMDKHDFLNIRSSAKADKEQAIVDYQLELLGGMPEDIEELISFWGNKLRSYWKDDNLDRYIYTMGLNDFSWTDSEISELSGLDMFTVTMARQLLGEDIVFEIAQGRYGIRPEFWHETVLKLSAELKREINRELYERLIALPELSSIRKSLLLKLAIINHDYERCISIIKDAEPGMSEDHLVHTNVLQSLATSMPLELHSFYSVLAERGTNPGYNFFLNLLEYTRYLFENEDKLQYKFALDRMDFWLRALWMRDGVDARTFSILGDVWACQLDCLKSEGDYHNLQKKCSAAISYAYGYMRDMKEWCKYYCFYLNHQLGYVDNVGMKDFLLKNFIGPYRKGVLKFSENEDNTSASTLFELLAGVLSDEGEYDSALEYMSKSREMGLTMLKAVEDGNIETRLRAIDVKRNIMVNTNLTLQIIRESGVEPKGDISESLRYNLELCSDEFRKGSFNDLGRTLYWLNALMLASLSEKSVPDKIEAIYRLLYEANGEKAIFALSVFERSSKQCSLLTEIYFCAHALLMELLQSHDGQSIDQFDSYGHIFYGDEISKIINTGDITFESLKVQMMPEIGSKLEEDMLAPRDLKPYIADIYAAVIKAEMAKWGADKTLIVKLANSLENEIESYNGDSVVHIHRHDRLIERVWTSYGDDGAQMEEDDYSDCFGFAAKTYTAQGDAWENGDPELNCFDWTLDEANDDTLSLEQLDEMVENEDYDALIALNDRENLTAYEAYYLGLAMLRTDRPHEALEIYNYILREDLEQKQMSPGEYFSTCTNYLISALLAGDTEAFIQFYEQYDEDEKADDDIVPLYEAYLKMTEQGNSSPDLDKPYGYQL